MPCNSDYLEATHEERAMSEVLTALDWIRGKPWSSENWSGYHPRAYNQHLSKADRDKLVATLCTQLGARKQRDIQNMPLEIQMWWRNHQEADRQRRRREAADKVRKAERELALAKLTPRERKILGVR